MQETQIFPQNTDFFQSYEAMEQEIEVLDREQTLRIEIDSGLETALRELEDLKSQIPKEKAQNLFELCETNVINTIKGQFGASELFKTSKEGGQVSTTHNARENIYGINEEKERLAYEKLRGEKYDYDKYHGEQYRQNKEKVKNQELDYMTGKELDSKSCDHILPASEIHKNESLTRKASLAEIDKNTLANKEQNLKMTDPYLNSLKNANNVEQFNQIVDKKIQEFENKRAKGTLSGEDAENLKKLKSIKWEELKKAEADAIKTIDNAIDEAYYTSSKPYKELATSIGLDVKNIAKGGLKSALAIVIARLVKELFAELRHIFKHFGDESFSEIFARLKERLSKVISEIKQDFKGIFEGSIEQSIGAFLSNIVLFIINIFVSTAKRVTQIIRAGFGSLIKAIKILANPPANMPKDEVAFEALKVFTAGIITAGSLFLEEGIDKFITTICPFLAPVSDFIAITLSALIGGVLSTIVLYYMDKAMNSSKRDKLQLQIMTKSGEVVWYKTAQSYFVLKDGFLHFAQSYERASVALQNASNEIKKSSEGAKASLKELKNVNDELRLIYQKLEES